jgi:membrane-bound lytic murein transglycosylase B
VGAFVLTISLSLWLSPRPNLASADNGDTPDWAFVERTLKKNGFGRRFIHDMRISYEIKHFDQVLELNLLLYLRKVDIHSVQVGDAAVKAIKTFLNDHATAFKKAEKSHGVPASVIASLLWLESRYGESPGQFHVPSAFLHLLQAKRPGVLEHLKSSAVKFTANPTANDFREIAKRARSKSQWALAELKALEKIHRKNASFVLGLRGSFAGAFGMPQFLPSSYTKWAKGVKKGKSPDLYNPDDSIQSVAFYLKDNGWRQNKLKSHMKALLRYNNSEDYARTILTLAKLAEANAELKRLPAESSLGQPGRSP